MTRRHGRNDAQLVLAKLLCQLGKNFDILSLVACPANQHDGGLAIEVDDFALPITYRNCAKARCPGKLGLGTTDMFLGIDLYGTTDFVTQHRKGLEGVGTADLMNLTIGRNDDIAW